MAAIEEGKVVIMLRGRRAGEKFVVTKVEEPFIYVKPLAGKGKERKVSIRHVEPTKEKL